MIQLIYLSHATRPMTQAALIELLTQARERNLSEDITGLLLYGKGKFLQILEGNARSVNAIYECIVKDNRNYGHVLIQIKSIEERRFSRWAMGFRNLSEQPIDLDLGYIDFFEQDLPEALVLKNHKEIESLLVACKESL